jgi:hypothetical protein
MALAKIWQVLKRLGIGGEETQIDATSQLIRLGRDEYKYVEGERSLILQIDMLMREPKRMIYSSTIKRWMPPYQNEEITEADRRRIASKIADFFSRRRISAIVK